MEDNDNIITLIDEEGEEHDFEVIMTLNLEDKEYTILLPIDAGEDEDAYVFKIVKDSNDEYLLEAIEDDVEYNNVVDAYEAILNDESM